MNKDEIQEKLVEAIKTNPHRDEICKVSLFGSYAYGTPKEDSDVDVLIEFEPDAPIGLFEFVRIRRAFSEFIGKKVDLLTPEALSKYFRDEVLASAKTIYEK
jgi:predicted nucleotidyltransferase